MKRQKTNVRSYFVHPTAIVEPGALIGPGTRIWAYAHIQSGAAVGAGCNVGNYCFVESGATLGNGVTVKNGVQLWEGVKVEDNVFIGPGCLFTNDRFPRAFRKESKKSWLKETVLRKGCSLGAGATLLCGIEIGRYAFVAAGALVTHSVTEFTRVMGRPAVFSSWVCYCGRTLIMRKNKSRCPHCRQEYFLNKKNMICPQQNTLNLKNQREFS